jgi:hypothetical protein
MADSGSGGVGNSILVSFHPVTNSGGSEAIRVQVVFWFLVMEVPSMIK